MMSVLLVLVNVLEENIIKQSEYQVASPEEYIAGHLAFAVHWRLLQVVDTHKHKNTSGFLFIKGTTRRFTPNEVQLKYYRITGTTDGLPFHAIKRRSLLVYDGRTMDALTRIDKFLCDDGQFNIFTQKDKNISPDGFRDGIMDFTNKVSYMYSLAKYLLQTKHITPSETNDSVCDSSYENNEVIRVMLDMWFHTGQFHDESLKPFIDATQLYLQVLALGIHPKSIQKKHNTKFWVMQK
eukprot:GHVR01096304.1.p1 GENE.GHVR01096304.1~~GHVR01096304.1.p1  ORF type:complete len:275 (+),score=31.82 GHVR01096304.1:113-826(+)